MFWFIYASAPAVCSQIKKLCEKLSRVQYGLTYARETEISLTLQKTFIIVIFQ